jgi:hypothetical protein
VTYLILTDRAGSGYRHQPAVELWHDPDSNGRFRPRHFRFLLLGCLPWKCLKTWWPTKHVRACCVTPSKVVFDRRSGPKIAVLPRL